MRMRNALLGVVVARSQRTPAHGWNAPSGENL
jgi:hypothetical protein